MRMAAWAALFFAGGFLAIRLLAAMYAFLDLFGRLRSAWPGLLARLATWILVAGAMLVFAGPGFRSAVVLGAASLLVWYLAAFALRHLLVRRMPRLLPPPR